MTFLELSLSGGVFVLAIAAFRGLTLRRLPKGTFVALWWLAAARLLLPVGGFMSGLSLGRRHGFCPLYPLACGLFYLPAVFLLMNASALFHCAIALCAALAGNLAGAARRRMKRKKGAETP